MPTCGTRYYRWSADAWVQVYAEDLTPADKDRISRVLLAGAEELQLVATQSWGPLLEDRESQITFSALGQQAPYLQKAAWDPDGAKKESLREYAASRLPDFEVRSGGSTSIDVTRQGIDKSYGMRKLLQQLGLTVSEALFIGDRLNEGGNDYPVLQMGVPTIAVRNWQDTVDHIRTLVADLT